ncbi:MAG: glycosyltransferase family 2 protein [Planctomycetota bacterium]
MQPPRVSIVVPHFQTEILARLCLRSIRKHTASVPYEVIVVDNASKDGASLQYLRQVEWIRLIERRSGVASTPGESHKEALDIGMAASLAPYILSFHTDTIPLRDDWLTWLLSHMEFHPEVAAVGTYKLEFKSGFRQVLKGLESWFRPRKQREEGDHIPYIRSHCALYRRDALDRLGLHFVDGSAQSAGRSIHFALEAQGYQAKLISAAETAKRVVHLNHGTMVLVSELGVCRKTARDGTQRIHEFLDRPTIREVLADASLDKADPTIRRSA